ncbi:MAG: hypothetical protein LBS33_01860 [Streptococcaceae bacterium]|jgi:hypothetical protein|nr:hypothetical protein [Streptococcaceae bacterium]
MKAFACSKQNLKLLQVTDSFEMQMAKSIKKLAENMGCSEKTVRGYMLALKRKTEIYNLEQGLVFEIRNLKAFMIVHHQVALGNLKQMLIHETKCFQHIQKLIFSDTEVHQINRDFLYKLECVLNQYGLKWKLGSLRGREENIQKLILDFCESHFLVFKNHAIVETVTSFLKNKIDCLVQEKLILTQLSIFFQRKDQLRRITSLEQAASYFEDNYSFIQFSKDFETLVSYVELSVSELQYMYLILLKDKGFRDYYNIYRNHRQTSQLENVTFQCVKEIPNLSDKVFNLHVDLLLYNYRLEKDIIFNVSDELLDKLAQFAKNGLKLSLPFAEVKKHYAELLRGEIKKATIWIGFTEDVTKKDIDNFKAIYGGIFDLEFFFAPLGIRVDLILAKDGGNLRHYKFYKQVFIDQIDCPLGRSYINQILLLILQNKRMC